MARLTPVQLQAARVSSGRLGGRPRKPTVAEARQAALEELGPAAIRSLKEHLGNGDPSAWRASLRVLEMAFSRPEDEEPSLPTDAADITNMGWRELRILAAKLTLYTGKVTDTPTGRSAVIEAVARPALGP
jgi:hypothetical protein